MRRLLLLFCFVVLTVPSYAQLMTYNEIISGDITTDRTLTANKRYLLSGFVKVKEGATLTIEPGTLIMGEQSSKATLIIERGGKIMAEGTADRPIVFTSQYMAGSRNPGDWGGIIIAGRASLNIAGGEATLEGGTATTYGGGANPNDDDNSGVLRYVRIEYPGIAYQPNNEINGLTLGAVGRGTTIEHVQVSRSGDDSFEWFGGTVNAKYLVAMAAVDDDFDTDNGFRGNIQYGLVIRDPQVADVSGSNGFESDNDATGSTNTPRTAPTYSNITVIGPQGFGADINPNYKRGAHIRRSSNASIFNSVVVGFPTGLLIDGSNTTADATSGALKIQNSYISGTLEDNQDTFDVTAWFGTQAFGNQTLTAPADAMLASAYTFFSATSSFDPMPAAGSPLLTGAAFTDARLADAFFEHTAFIGAFAPATEPWYLGWANFTPQDTDYRSGIPAAAEQEDLPVSFTLNQNYPNPFNPSTTIEFAINQAQNVQLTVYDVLGHQVAVLADGIQAAGTHAVRFDAGALSSGMYIYQLKTENGVINKTMSLVK